MRTVKKKIVTAMFLLGLFVSAVSASTVYVDADATGSDNGTSWTDAYVDLQDGLSDANNDANVLDIWVAEGTYKADGSDPCNRDLSFELVADVNVYGGFDGNSTDFNNRDWSLYETILSGDINNVGDVNDNTKTIVKGADGAVFDGFVITKAYGGRGLYNGLCSMTVANCVFAENQGGSGAAINTYNYGSPVFTTIENSLFVGNTTTGNGGAIWARRTGLIITNSTFYNNDSGSAGGAIYFDPDDMSGIDSTADNCILWGNTAVTADTNELGIGGYRSQEFTFSNCDIADSNGSAGWTFGHWYFFDGGGNIDSDPEFVDASDPDGSDGQWMTADDGLVLGVYSPCINAGDNSAASGIDKDLKFDDRVINGVVDIGAYETVFESIFTVLDDSDASIAIFDDVGNLFLKGTMDTNSVHTATGEDEFIILDSSNSELTIIDANDGNMYLNGYVFENQSTFALDGTNHFIIEDGDGNTVAYIDDPNGDLYLKGKLYESDL